MPNHTIADQLQPLGDRLFPRVPRQTYVVQFLANLGGESPNSVDEARREVLKWLQRRSGKLPDTAWKFEDFELPTPGTPSAGVRLQSDDVDYWAVRLDYMDDSVAGRTWLTEISIAYWSQVAAPLFGLRLSVASRDPYTQFDPAVPGVIRQIAKSPGLLRNEQWITDTPWIVSDEEGVERLIELIENGLRRRPIYVIALPEGQNNPNSAVIDPFELAGRCIGLAHVVVLTSPASYLLTDRVGKALSVFRGAVRTYQPDCDIWSDSPYDHFLALPDRVLEWAGDGPGAFMSELVRQAARKTLDSVKGENDLPSFGAVKQTALRLKRQKAEDAGRSESDLLELAELEMDGLKQELDGWQALAMGEEESRRTSEAELLETRAQIHWLRERVDDLEQRIQSSGYGSVDDEIVVPESLAELRIWAEKYLPGLIHITGRAIRAAKGSDYEEVELAYKSVLLLARQYRDMRLGKSKEAFDEQCAMLGVECSPTHAGSRAGEQGDDYFVKYKGRKQYLDMHIKKGTSRETRHCLRLYFFWDDQDRQVVVGSMPGHLTTRAT